MNSWVLPKLVRARVTLSSRAEQRRADSESLDNWELLSDAKARQSLCDHVHQGSTDKQWIKNQ
uniref:Uncharacterized protein n=1 Tax=Romanomermis culicivorax TaxID=13658 RepID=A0A915KZD7_ROMCU